MRRIKRLLGVISAGIVSVSSLFVLAPTVHAAADTCTWTGLGGDSNFSTAANWSDGAGPVVECDGSGIPEDGDALVFPQAGVTNFTANNDIVDLGDAPGVGITSISFNGAMVVPACYQNTYNITGIAIKLSGTVNISHTGGACDSTQHRQTIAAPIVVSGAVTVNGSTSTAEESLEFNGSITGSGSLLTRGSAVTLSNVDQSVTIGAEDKSFVYYKVNSCSSVVINNVVSLASDASLSAVLGFVPCDAFTITSAILSLDTAFHAGYADVTIGSLTSNGYQLTVSDGSATTLNVNSQTLTGNYVDVTYSANSPGTPLYAREKTRATVSGTYGTTTVGKLAYLKGGGTLGSITVNTGGFLAPGNSPGCLNSGNLTLAGTYQVEIQGATACTNYDQMKVTGTVNVTGGTLSLATTGFVPTTGQKFVIIDNDGTADAVTGTFTGLAEGTTVVDGGVTYTISYVGGDGNDVELTVTAVNAAAIPGAPNTGFKLLTANPLATLLGGLLAAAGFGILARRQFANNK